jgi:hypothetical protein
VYRIDADAELAELQRGGLGHTADRPLAGAVGNQTVLGLQAVDGRDIDDGATAGAFHGLDHATHPEEGANLIDADHALVVRQRGIGDGSREDNRRIVQQHVQGPQLRHGTDRAGPVILTTHIQTQIAGGGSEFGGERLTSLIEHIGEQHPGALAHEEPRRLLALPARSTRDDRNLPVQASHL